MPSIRGPWMFSMTGLHLGGPWMSGSGGDDVHVVRHLGGPWMLDQRFQQKSKHPVLDFFVRWKGVTQEVVRDVT